MDTPFDFNDNPTPEMVKRINLFCEKYKELYNLIEENTDGLQGPYRSCALYELESSANWLNKAVTHGHFGKE